MISAFTISTPGLLAGRFLCQSRSERGKERYIFICIRNMCRMKIAGVFSSRGVETSLLSAAGISRYWCVFLTIWMAKRAMDVASRQSDREAAVYVQAHCLHSRLRARTGAQLKTAAPLSESNGFELPVTKSFALVAVLLLTNELRGSSCVFYPYCCCAFWH